MKLIRILLIPFAVVCKLLTLALIAVWSASSFFLTIFKLFFGAAGILCLLAFPFGMVPLSILIETWVLAFLFGNHGLQLLGDRLIEFLINFQAQVFANVL